SLLVSIVYNRRHQSFLNGYSYGYIYVSVFYNLISMPGAVHLRMLAKRCSTCFDHNIIKANLAFNSIVNLLTGIPGRLHINRNGLINVWTAELAFGQPAGNRLAHLRNPMLLVFMRNSSWSSGFRRLITFNIALNDTSLWTASFNLRKGNSLIFCHLPGQWRSFNPAVFR